MEHFCHQSWEVTIWWYWGNSKAICNKSYPTTTNKQPNLDSRKNVEFCVEEIKEIYFLFLKNQEISNTRVKWKNDTKELTWSLEPGLFINSFRYLIQSRCKICFWWSLLCHSVWLQYCSFTWARGYIFSFSVCSMFLW